MSMESFYTRSSANAGIELPLYTPDGKKSEHHLRIVGIDSDLFREKELEEKRRALNEIRAMKDPKDEKEKDRLEQESTRRLLASMIISWSFPEECTEENKVAFLREAPQIAAQINRHSADRTLFFVNASTNSPDSQKPTSN